MGKATMTIANLVRQSVRSTIHFFYPKLEITGRDFIPESGAVLFVANHANSLIDPVIIGMACERPVHFLAKAPLFDIPIFGPLMRVFGMIPVYRGSDDAAHVSDNVGSLAAAADFLARGEAVGIFPEGKSHDAMKVDKVRSGAARIAVQAVQSGATSLKIVPVGINYERKEKFRSSVWVRIGEPIELGQWNDRIAEDDRAAFRSLTAEIDQRLKDVVIHLNEDKWEPFVEDLEALLPDGGQPRETPIAALQQRKRIADAMNHFLATDRTRAEEAAAAIQAHRTALQGAGLNVQSDLFRLRYTRLFVRQTWDVTWLFCGFVPALLGTVYNLVPFLAIRLIGLAMPKANRSTVALTKLGLGVPAFGAWYGGMWWLLARYFVPGAASIWSILMILAGIFALSYWSRGKRAALLWWSEFRMLVQPEKLERLRQNHFALTQRLSAMAQEYRQIHPVQRTEPVTPLWTPKFITRAAAWTATALLVVLFVFWGFSVWEQSRISVLSQSGLDLRSLSSESLGSLLAEDEQALVEVIAGLRDVEKAARQTKADLLTGRRGFYSQDDNNAIRQLLFSYLTYRTELLRLIWKYQDYENVPQTKLRLEAFLVELTAGSALYESSLKLVTDFADTPQAIRKLNEGEPLWGIPPDLYDTVRINLAAPKNRKLMKDALTAYHRLTNLFSANRLAEGMPYRLFHEVIAESEQATADVDVLAGKWLLGHPLEQAAKEGKIAVYRGQSLLSTWVGDTRIRQPREGKPLIQPEQLRQLRTMLKPGDILLERQNWYLSRAFMPGYWAHAAFYVGTANDLASMGLDKDPRVQKFWKEFAACDAAGHEHVILEAVPRGVRMTTLEHCIGVADSAAALRPQIAPSALPEVIAQAFVHVGKPYDFEFDFFSTDKLVCTELVYRCCDKQVDFPLVEVLGRKTLPPTEMVRKFARELGAANAQLAFVAFLDGQESVGQAQFRDAKALADSADRPSLTWLQEK